ncbi:hypothetical protein [Leucobacter sp. cx-169]|uniref:hypothetical protein n=1 Tax=Leucobacter sp. cx-169 TaxID=2770549 RepID=UPI00165D8AF0|nr:hypothetical protein [Leucobacter sp. cx-169]MBC9927189.1 hypothetical protein [Leucobacter sp. cx-169]
MSERTSAIESEMELLALTGALHAGGAFDASQVAELLRGQPDLLAQFERAYERSSDGYSVIGPAFADVRQPPTDGQIAAEDLIDGIVGDLATQTPIWSTAAPQRPALSRAGSDQGSMARRTASAMSLDSSVRPMATGDALTRDMPEGGAAMRLQALAQSQSIEGTDDSRQQAYHRFRQGLDILDLDDLTHQMIAQNPDSMGFWLPKLMAANAGRDLLRIPETTIVTVPLPLLQLTRLEYGSINGTTHEIVNRWAKEVFGLRDDGDYFIKTGTFSSKFDFRNARVRGGEVAELGDYLLYVHQLALSMASPLNTPSVYGAGTTVEWAVREFIEAEPGTPTIYHGLPLRCEFRVFVDCDRDRVLSVVPYWEPRTMKRRFSEMSDRDDPNNRHDLVTFLMAEPELARQVKQLKRRVSDAVADLLPSLDLPGQWSLDVMVNGDDLWAIDMAQAHTSAFYESVPKRQRQPLPVERWLPQLEG